MITVITPDRDYLCPRARHLKIMRSAAAWRKQAVMANRGGDRKSWRRLMSYTCQMVDEAARYRMDNVERMRLP